MGNVKCDHIRRLMTLTSDNIKRLSLYLRNRIFTNPKFKTKVNLIVLWDKVKASFISDVTKLREGGVKSFVTILEELKKRYNWGRVSKKYKNLVTLFIDDP
jgi:hypothetical protein